MITYYVHTCDPFVVKFPAGFFIDGIRWYGVCYLLTFVFAIAMMNVYTNTKKSQLSIDDNYTFLTYGVFGVLLGGRIGYMLLYNLGEFFDNPLKIFAIWEGGMASHGGFLGVIFGIIYFCRRHNKQFLPLADICSTLAPFGFAIGRLANFINGELYGKITNVRWAVIFSDHFPRHPSQLYESFFEGFVLLIYMQLRFWFRRCAIPGKLSGEFLILYSIFRIIGEVFREPDADLIFGLSRGQFYSLFLLTIGIILLIATNIKHNRRNDKPGR